MDNLREVKESMKVISNFESSVCDLTNKLFNDQINDGEGKKVLLTVFKHAQDLPAAFLHNYFLGYQQNNTDSGGLMVTTYPINIEYEMAEITHSDPRIEIPKKKRLDDIWSGGFGFIKSQKCIENLDGACVHLITPEHEGGGIIWAAMRQIFKYSNPELIRYGTVIYNQEKQMFPLIQPDYFGMKTDKGFIKDIPEKYLVEYLIR